MIKYSFQNSTFFIDQNSKFIINRLTKISQNRQIFKIILKIAMTLGFIPVIYKIWLPTFLESHHKIQPRF